MKKLNIMLEDKIVPQRQPPFPVRISVLLLTACLVVCLPCPVAQAVALTAADMYLDPASIPPADYTYPDYSTDYTATFSNVLSLQVLPPLVDGADSYYFIPTVDYTGDITGTDGSISFLRAGPYFVLATYTNRSTALFDYGINSSANEPPTGPTSKWHKIPTPAPDVVIIDPAIKHPPSYGSNTTVVTNLTDWDQVVGYMTNLHGAHVELEGNGSPGNFYWQGKSVLSFNTHSQQTLNSLVGCVSNLTFISCKVGQGTDGSNFLQNVANTLGKSAGYTDIVRSTGEDGTPGELYINGNGKLVTFAEEIPEPSTCALLAIGLIALFSVKRHRA